MGESDGLCALKVSIARHVCGQVFARKIDQGIAKCSNQGEDLLGLVDRIKPLVECDLVITASSGVQTLSGIADPVGEFFFNEHMDVFRIRIKGEFSGIDIVHDGEKSLTDLVGVLLRDDALLGQHLAVGDGALDVLFIHSAIER